MFCTTRSFLVHVCVCALRYNLNRFGFLPLSTDSTNPAVFKRLYASTMCPGSIPPPRCPSPSATLRPSSTNSPTKDFATELNAINSLLCESGFDPATACINCFIGSLSDDRRKASYRSCCSGVSILIMVLHTRIDIVSTTLYKKRTQLTMQGLDVVRVLVCRRQ